MTHTIVIPTPEHLDAAAKEFLSAMGAHRLIAMEGRMGAGKTTFISALCKALGVDGREVNSPSFSVVNEYLTFRGESIYHFDFYRLESAAEALDIGLFEYLESGSLCIMEWPEIVLDFLPEDTLHVRLDVGEDFSRRLTWEEND